MDWRRSLLPLHDGSGWAIWRRGRVTKADFAEARATAARWLPPSPVLIGQPGAARFEPPISVPALRAAAMGAIARNTRIIVSAVLGLALMFAALAVAEFDVGMATWAALLSAFAALMYADFRIHLHSTAGVVERAMFFYALRTRRHARASLFFWFVFGSAFGLLQIAAQHRFGSIEGAFLQYGAMYPAIRAGEVWRLMTGPFLHYSLDHYFVNFALLVFSGWLATSLRGPASIAAFIVGCVGSATAQFLFGGQAYDNFGGISGGVFALLAFIITAGVLHRALLPRGMGMMLSGLLLLNTLSVELLNENAATTAHVAGIAIGMVFATATPGLWSNRPK